MGLVTRAPVEAPVASDVRAYALNHQSKDLLEQLRCWPEAAHATPVLSMHAKEVGGGEVRFTAAQSGVPAMAWIVDVLALEARLAEAAGFQPNIERFDAPQNAALAVICEGQASVSRQQMGVELDVTAYPHWAIAARVTCELPHGQDACQWFTPDDVLGFLPLGGETGNSMAVVWSVNEASKVALLDDSAEAFAEKLQLASENRFGRLVLSSERAAWPLRLAMAQHWCGVTTGQSWVLAGDAAHAVHPLSGQGLNLGLADVRELAHQLQVRDYWRSVGDARMLRRYERARKADVSLMGRTTDGLQLLFARQGSLWRSVRNWGMDGFERSGPLKRWVARQAMGMQGPEFSGVNKTL